MRSVLPNLPAKSKAFAKLPKDNIFKATAECLDSSKNSCLTEIINGAIVDIWANIEGLWTLLKGAGKLAAFGWKSMWGIEDKSTDAMHAALGQTGDAIAMFIKNPIAFLKQMVSGLIDYTNEAIKNNFGCEKWSGTPHFSTCLQPMPSWSCATCNQRINAVCGVAGALGGEVLLAFATGGTVAAVKGGVTATKAGVATAKGAVKATKAYAKTAAAARSATAAVGKAFAKTGIKSGLRIAAQDVAKKARAVLSSKAAKAIAAQAAKAGKGMKYAATIAGKGIKTVANKKPVKIALISAKPGAKEAAQEIKDVTTPVRWYLKQMDNAYKAGFNAVDTKLTKAAQGAKMTEEVAKAKILESDIEDIKLHVSADDAPTTSAASVEQKLKDNGYTYKTEKTPDGETKFAVTADCPPNGVKRCNIVIGK
jgi:hypothetical protein